MSYIQFFIYFPAVTKVICPAQQPTILPFLAIVEFYRESEETVLAKANKKNWAKQHPELLC